MYRKLLMHTGVPALAVAGFLLLAGPAAAQAIGQGWPLQSNYGRSSYSPSSGPGYFAPSYSPAYVAPAAVPAASATAPAAAESNPSYLTSAAADNEGPLAAQINVRAPADAKIWFNQTRMPQAGAFRHFLSPPLTPGQDYFYQVRVRWHQDGREVTRTRNVSIHAGDRLNLAFGPSETGASQR